MKSLRKDLIEVEIIEFGDASWWWRVTNHDSFGIANLYMTHNARSQNKAKADFRKIAKLNGWKNYKFI